MQEKFTFNLETPRFKKKMILFKEEQETREHVVLKLLSYVLFYDPALKIEVGIGAHYKPDLVIEGDHGVPVLWIDCGQVTLRKFDAIVTKYRKTRILIVKSEKRETEAFRKLALKRNEEVSQAQFVYFNKGFVQALADSLDRSNDVVQWNVTETDIGIALGEQVFESTVHFL